MLTNKLTVSEVLLLCYPVKKKGNKLLVDLSESEAKKQVRFRFVQLYCLMPDSNTFFSVFSILILFSIISSTQ